MIADALGSLGLSLVLLGAVSLGAAIPWAYGVGLLLIGAICWAMWGR